MLNEGSTPRIRRAWDHGAVLRRPAPRWLTGGSRAFRLRDGQLRRIAASSPPTRSPMLARQADGRPGPFGRCGLADRRPVPAVRRRTRPAHGRPNALFCTNFARHIRRRVGPAGRLSRGRADVSRLTPYPLRKGRCTGKAAPAARRDAGPHISGDMPGGRAAPTFLPDAPRQTAVPLRERYLPPFPGQTRAQQGPLDHPPRSPRGQGPATGTHHAT